MNYLKLSGGVVYDPKNGIDGEKRDIWICDGKVVMPPEKPVSSVRNYSLDGRVVMPGGIDMHSHVAGPKVNAARKMQPEHARNHPVSSFTVNQQFFFSGSLANVPSIYTTGYRYTGLGYTTCFDAAVTPLSARQVHLELSEMPNLDTGFFTLVGNNHFALQSIAKSDTRGLEAFIAWLLTKSGSYALKMVNPGGAELWKQSRQGNARDLDQIVDGFDTTPRKVIQKIAAAANNLGLPHPIHIHCNNLGIPGNWTTTLETMKSLDGMRAHLTHIQFHSYGRGDQLGGDSEGTTLLSQAQPLADYINSHPNLTVDVGQVLFGQTTSMTGDSPLGYFLQKLHGQRWYSNDVEQESGCGVSPIEYRDQNFVHALQWAIGLEWYLLVKNPWQIAMTTDHPNGGSFWAYPQIIRLLMDSGYRRQRLSEVHPQVLQKSALPELDREYTLSEIAIITRAAPARILGLSHKGHLGVGADADIAVYTPNDNYETMFSLPFLVLKRGEILIEDCEFRNSVEGETIAVSASHDREFDSVIEAWFDQNYSLKAHHYGIGKTEIPRIRRY